MLACGMLTACSNDDPESFTQPARATFSAQIGNVQSRAAGAEWAVGDAIGISGVSGAKSYTNVEYTTASGDGNFAATGNGIFYQTPDEVLFTAYYPYAADLGTDGIITASTTDQSAQSSFDFLWAQGSGSYDYPDVRFNFAHRMAQLNISFTNGNDVDLSDLTYTVGGLKTEGTFDTATGEAAATGSFATLTAPVTADHKSSLILFPQVAERLVFNATADGQQYRCFLYIGNLNAGASYDVTITVSKTEMSVANCTISEWKNGGSNETGLYPVQYIGNKRAEQAGIGDYYMNDGSLVDKDAALTDAQKEACIGIVFSTDPDRIGADAEAALAAKGVLPHGLVMALTNAADNTRWGVKDRDEPGVPTVDNASEMYQEVNGYGNTKWIIENHQLQDAYSAFYYASIYGKSEETRRYAAPDDATDWFMPSTGNWWDLLRNLGKVEGLDDFQEYQERFFVIRDCVQEMAGNLNYSMSQIEGAQYFEPDANYWASTEAPYGDVRFIGMYSNGSLKFSYVPKSTSTYKVRCVLAF